ncbi:amidohydrolase [Kitasatospora sp. NE20-6]|uniref:amidohydrolase family protein n=1 Tax=Kitasatospora sp. NE20-6 TaxID=2859066 RepID=UPI0034DBEE73
MTGASASGDGRIDVHQHMMPPVWAEAVVDAPNGPPFVPAWSEEDALRAMDAVGTRKGILSVTAPGVHLGDDAAARRLARAVNVFGAEVVGRRPDRFGLFASLPLPDVEGAVAEAVFALDELHADGVALMSNADGRYLGDPEFRPLWQALDERAAVVFVHPTLVPGLPELPGAHGWVDFPFDTTRTAVHMVINGVLRDFPSVKIILSHAGGFVPYVAPRIEALTMFSPGLSADEVHRDLRRFYYDTALASGPATLAGLLEFAGPGHVVFGTDWPAAPLPVATRFADSLDHFLTTRPGWSDRINHETTASLIPQRGERPCLT